MSRQGSNAGARRAWASASGGRGESIPQAHKGGTGSGSAGKTGWRWRSLTAPGALPLLRNFNELNTNLVTVFLQDVPFLKESICTEASGVESSRGFSRWSNRRRGHCRNKMPKTAENLMPEEAIRTVPIIRRIFEDAAGNRMNQKHYYYYQIQGQLHITGRKHCLFCIWTRNGLKYIKIDKDDNFWQNNMEPKLIEFYEQCMLPELIDSQYNRGMPIREPPSKTEERVKEKRKRSPSDRIKNNDFVRRRTELQSAVPLTLLVVDNCIE